jgi:RepB plasmid partitioning protein
MRLDQLSTDTFELLKDKPVIAATLNVLRWMKPTRQIEAANLMVSTGNYSKSFAKALLVATNPAERVTRRMRPVCGLSREQKDLMQQELENLLKDIGVTESYGTDVLSLVVASSYISRLISNQAIESYLGSHHAEILEQFRAILSAATLDMPPIDASVDHPKRYRGHDRRVSRTRRSPRGAPPLRGIGVGVAAARDRPFCTATGTHGECLPDH